MLAAACGGASPAAAPQPVHVRASGAGRRVDARVNVSRVVDPAHTALQRAAPGTRFVQLDVEWRNLAGALPVEWATVTMRSAVAALPLAGRWPAP